MLAYIDFVGVLKKYYIYLKEYLFLKAVYAIKRVF